MFSAIAFPLYDVDDAPGAGAPAGDDDGDGSLSDHEAAFGDGATRPPAEPATETDETEAEPPAARERNADGTFTKPRHRAKSQQASAEDVPRISELTRKFREAEERATAAERRAEEAERRAAARREDAREPAKPEPAREASKPKFPTFEDWQAIDGNPKNDWYAYDDAKAEWRYETRRAAERAEEASATAAREARELDESYYSAFDAARKELPDFDAVLATVGPRDVSLVVERAVKAVGPKAAYYLAKHHEELVALTADTLYADSGSPAFTAAVAATRRYLSSLVASQRPSSSSRAVAGSTGAARASLAPPAPPPPTLVRTGATRDADEAPDDEGSLADHEKAFGPKRRRA